MTPERHQQIKRLFLAAVELAPNQVDPFLALACGADDDLRSEVQSLLDHHRAETLLGAGESTGAEEAPTTPLFSESETMPRASPAALAGRRPAGSLIAGRYRLIWALGHGGMGVVFRAEDLELGQTVALKFLSQQRQEQPEALESVRQEVRIARRITHPNVVRIFDVETAEGETFISMEFVPGEDLESLVRRVGPLSAPKVSQIARQMAAGLAAAHDAGVLHRDLKPANVMIDGAGNVRLLDFGIAAPLEDDHATKRLMGTPGFLAPELLAGEKPSRGSDLYAWGLVVHYAATGESPVLENHGGDRETAPLLTGVSYEVAECVRWCLQTDPARRPASAHDLIVALFGGDPIDAALRAGQMPSAELVAAASSWRPSIRLLDALLGAGLALLVLITLLADRTLFLSRCGLMKSPEVLKDIAEQTLAETGRRASNDAVMTGVTLDADCLKFVRAHPEIPGIWQRVSAGEVPAVSFWYRQGDPRLPRATFLEPDAAEPAGLAPGAAAIRLDGRGKLLSLEIGESVNDEGPPIRTIQWSRLFELAGLPWSEFREVQGRPASLGADAVYRWEGPFSADESQYVAVVAATRGGRVVYFDVAQPWETPRMRRTTREPNSQTSHYVAARTAIWLVAILVAACLAWRHVHQSHADWRGAWRVTVCAFVLTILQWLCSSRHSLVLTEELAAAFDWLKVFVFCGAVAGVAYLAAEPSARRWWPWSIISLRRVLDGRVKDRRIWADVFVGLVVGLAAVFVRQLCTLLNQLLNAPVSGLNDFDLGQNLLDHFGLRYRVAAMISALWMALLESLLLLALVVAIKRLVKSTWITGVLLVLLLAAASIAGRGIVSPIDWIARTLLLSISAWLLLRFGLLATIAALSAFYAVNNAPLTTDWSRWFAPTALATTMIIAASIVCCWRLSRPGAAMSAAPRLT
jgi:serine/threonine-protein kinase